MLAKRYSGLTVIANGKLDDPATAVSMLAAGSADVIAPCRTLWDLLAALYPDCSCSGIGTHCFTSKGFAATGG
ncbi:MAG: hypothetical protein JWO93_56 [Micrococcaceae bacterium]|nr:hypothetical protein [Micrococcaceae bacterium]